MRGLEGVPRKYTLEVFRMKDGKIGWGFDSKSVLAEDSENNAGRARIADELQTIVDHYRKRVVEKVPA